VGCVPLCLLPLTHRKCGGVNNLNDYAYVECVDKAKALIKKNDDAMSALIGDREA
jgi:hypothetical protein